MRNQARGNRLRAALAAVALMLTGLAAWGCGTFDIADPNEPTLTDLQEHPTRAKLSAFASGIFAAARGPISSFIWRVGSLGREGVELSGTDQVDHIHPYLGPVDDFIAWDVYYSQVRNLNVYLDAVPRAPDLDAGAKAASIGFGDTYKALAFMFVVATHGELGAPVDVGGAVDAPPAPFVTEDSVYGYIIGLLDAGAASLQTATDFPFPIPSGLADFATPATFLQLNRGLAAKALLMRATASNSSCGPAACYTAALAALAQSFLTQDAQALSVGAYYNRSDASGDIPNNLSEQLDGISFFALPQLITDAQLQVDGVTPDARILAKTAPKIGSPQTVPEFPISGDLKFTIYLDNGEPDPSAPIPMLRNEELLLLRAEANIGLNDLPSALADLNFIRVNTGNLPPLVSLASQGAAIDELIYNRRYSLLWEQGTSWVDARRYGRLGSLPIPPGFANGASPQPGIGPSVVPPRIPVPGGECLSRGLAPFCSPLGT